MTLIELLVVLVILAGMAVTVSVSSSGMIERARVEKTQSQGEAMREALEAHDGLSIVSDLGAGYLRAIRHSMTNTVDGTDTSPLYLLFDFRHPLEVYVATEGDDPIVSSLEKEVVGYQSVSSTNKYWEIVYAEVTNATAKAHVQSRFDRNPVSLGGGWRGPYCGARVLDEGRQLRDGFGGAWRLGTNSTSRTSFAFSLVSFGRDRVEGETDWADSDAAFDVGMPTTTLCVTGDVGEDVTIVSFHAFYFEPSVKLTYDSTVEETMELRESVKSASTTSCTFGATDIDSNDFITPGIRIVSAVGITSEGAVYHAPPRTVMVRPGSNSVKLTLRPE